MECQEKLNIITEFGRLIYGKKNLKDVFHIITTYVKKIVGADRCSLYLVDDESNELCTIIAHGLDYELRVPFSNGVAGFVAASKEVMIVDDAYNDERFDRRYDIQNNYTTKTLLTIPVINKYGVTVAVIQAINKINGLFTKDDSDLVLLIAEYISVVIENSICFEKLESTLNERTSELEELNQTLEYKIKEAMDEIKNKDEMLLLQTRRAAMGEMIGVIAHQLKQPITIIKLLKDAVSDALETDTIQRDEALENLKKIDNLTNFMSKTIDEFRNFFNPNKKKDRQPMINIINRACQIIERHYLMHKIELRVDCNITTELNLFSNEIVHAILNILKNAQDVLIERGVENRAVLVRGYEDGGFVYIEIEDNGGGIKDGAIEKIFSHYFSTKDQKIGTGIGLYISKIIIEEHSKGELSATNTKDGARFRIKLPKE